MNIAGEKYESSHLDCLKQRWNPLNLRERIHDSANNSKRHYKLIFLQNLVVETGC